MPTHPPRMDSPRLGVLIGTNLTCGSGRAGCLRRMSLQSSRIESFATATPGSCSCRRSGFYVLKPRAFFLDHVWKTGIIKLLGIQEQPFLEPWAPPEKGTRSRSLASAGPGQRTCIGQRELLAPSKMQRWREIESSSLGKRILGAAREPCRGLFLLSDAYPW